MRRGLTAKYSQNLQLYDDLKQTGQRVLLHANRNDSIWGTGTTLKDVLTNHGTGQNLLGKMLTDLRDSNAIVPGNKPNPNGTIEIPNPIKCFIDRPYSEVLSEIESQEYQIHNEMDTERGQS